MKKTLALLLTLGLLAGLCVLPAQAATPVDGIAYCGDSAASTMTPAQAAAIRAQIDQYAAAPSILDYSGKGQGDVYVALFDAGGGVPGVFMTKGRLSYSPKASTLSGGGMLYDTGESAVWTFGSDGALVPLPGITQYTDVALFPGCVECGVWAGDESYWDGKYYAAANGVLPATPSATLYYENNYDTGRTTYRVDGASVSASQYKAAQAKWQGTGEVASARFGGGVEFIIEHMTPAGTAAAALDAYIASAAAPAVPAVPVAYPATQTVELDGAAVELQCYALKDENGNLTNYVKLRDLALLLNGTAAQFAVVWDGEVIVATGKAYIPNGTEGKTPFTGERPYTDVTGPTKVNGQGVQLSAFVLTDDQGGGYTYYKLRDLGAALGFNVDWSADRGVFIETGKPYGGAN